MKRYSENIYILFDNDEAWRTATMRALKIAYRENVFPKVILLPQEFKDVDDLTELPNATEILDEAIKSSNDGFLQTYELLKSEYDLSSPIDKQKLFNDMFSLIVAVDNYTIQEHYKQLLADKVWLPYEVINLQLNKYIRTDGRFEQNKKKQKIERKIWQPARDVACAAIFYENYIEKYIENSELRANFLLFAKWVWKHRKSSLLQKVLEDPASLSDEEASELNEIQLWRENELDWLLDEDKKFATIKNTVLRTLNDALKTILKDKDLAVNIKQSLIGISKDV